MMKFLTTCCSWIVMVKNDKQMQWKFFLCLLHSFFAFLYFYLLSVFWGLKFSRERNIFRILFFFHAYMFPLLFSLTLQLDKYLSKYTNHLVNSFTTFPSACILKYTHTRKKWDFLLRRKHFSSLGWCSSLWSLSFSFVQSYEKKKIFIFFR